MSGEGLTQQDVLTAVAAMLRQVAAGKDAAEALEELSAALRGDLLREHFSEMTESITRLCGLIAEKELAETAEVASLRAQIALYERLVDTTTRALTVLARLQMDERLAKLKRESGQGDGTS